MANITLEQQYNFINWRRRVAKLYKEKMLLESKAAAQIAALRAYIVAGNDPTSSPEYKDLYFYLVNEYGDKFFEDEMQQFYLHKEEDKEQSASQS